MRKLLSEAAKYLERKRRHTVWMKVMSGLACIVVFCTVYSLILPAITLEKQEKILACPLSVHQHTDACYDENKNLICGNPEVTEHTHTDECYKDSDVIHFGEETEMVESESTYEDGEQNVDFTSDHSSDIMAAALTPTDLNDKTFALVNPVHKRALMATSQTEGRLDAARVSYASDDTGVHIYSTAAKGQEKPNYMLWTFKCIESNTYYITTTVNNQKKYLTIDYEGAPEASNVTVEDQIEDVAERNKKQVITVTEGTGDHAGQIRLTNAVGQAINKYYGQEYFGGWNGNNEDEYFYLADQRDPGTVEGVTPNGTVINLFDYWLTDRDSKHTGGDFGEGNKLDVGINKDHALKFTKGDAGGATNQYTTSADPRTGLVEKKLGEDNYPRLTEQAVDNSAGTTDKKPESLKYLFDPTVTNDFKRTFRNVGGLLQIDEEGYYYYNSQENFAELDESNKKFNLYETCGVNASAKSPDGQFFPFNSFAESVRSFSNYPEINHYFGMTLVSRFVQRYEGHTNSSQRTETVFEFSGDDDVWIFVDDVLVADLGGIHDMASLSINFASGEVKINGRLTTTLEQAFEAAEEVKDPEDWRDSTFADNTYHILKFYYLERGNFDSNMSLKYNLNAIPDTAIRKTDQYGRHLSGVQFSVYKSDSNWVYDPSSEPYTRITNDKGEIIFADEDGMSYTLKELKEDILGEYCVLKETFVPPGYRLVNNEVHLRVTDKAMICENTYDSGAWTTATLQLAAPVTLKLAQGDNNYQPFYDVENETEASGHIGTLFAIVVKKVGTEDIAAQESWLPVSGDSTNGYTVHQVHNGTEFIQAAIEIAKKDQENSVFKMARSGAMELTMTDMPGQAMEYYYMLDKADQKNAKYTVAFYWSSADSIEEATTGNTVRVNGDAEPPNAFDRAFGSTVEVPNLTNRLIVQKFDENKNLINGAIFALFKADENGAYIATDGSKVTLEDGKYTTEVHFDPNNDTASYAEITIKDDNGNNIKTIKSVEQRRTNDQVLQGSAGTCVFGIRQTYLEKGCYYLREVQPPPGYEINPKPIMVRVTDQAIYANAGTEGDGVQVACGPGYISSTLHKAASDREEDIDNTLTWIYQQLRVSGVSDKFMEVSPEAINTWGYATDSNGKKLTSYLHYVGKGAEVNGHAGIYVANYEVDKTDARLPLDETEIERTDTLQIATETGWSYNEIYQDYNYGYGKDAKGKYADYTDLTGYGDISNLFSRSVYVQVTDKKTAADPMTLKLKKVDAADSQKTLPDAKFVLYQTEGETKQYYSKTGDTVTWEPLTDGQAEESAALTTDEEGQITFQNLFEGTYFLKEVRAPDGYSILEDTTTFTVSQGMVHFGVASSGMATAGDDGKTIIVKNSSGIALPEAGGMGTMLFYIIGGILAIGAGILLVTRYRMTK